MTPPVSTTDLPPDTDDGVPRVVTAVRYRDGTAFGAPHAAPAIPRSVYPEWVPPGELRDRDYLLDVAAAATQTAVPGCRPPEWDLIEDEVLVLDLCRDYALACVQVEAARDEAQSAILDLEGARADLEDTRAQLFHARRRNAGLLSELGRLLPVEQIRAALDRAARAITGVSRVELDARIDAELGATIDPPPIHHARDQREADPDTVVVDDPEAP